MGAVMCTHRVFAGGYCPNSLLLCNHAVCTDRVRVLWWLNAAEKDVLPFCAGRHGSASRFFHQGRFLHCRARVVWLYPRHSRTVTVVECHGARARHGWKACQHRHLLKVRAVSL